MLQVPATFPFPGSWAWMDDVEPVTQRDVVEHVRILDRPDAQGQVGIAIRSRRFPREIASGNRRVPLSALREHEQAEPAPASRPARAPRRKAATGASATGKGGSRRR